MSSSSNFSGVTLDPLVFNLARRAVAFWDLDVESLEPIKVRENSVFRIVSGGINRAVLRIHRFGYHSDEALRSEFSWMEALRRSGINTPRPILSRSRNVFEKIEIPDLSEVRQSDVLDWVNGVQLGSVERGISSDLGSVEPAYRAIGELAARIHNQAANWKRPIAFARHAWDINGLVGECPLWGRFWELEALSRSQRRLLERVRPRLRRDLQEFGMSADRFGLIHADLVPENVLVDGKHLSVIDFDDAGFGWHIFELATTLYFIRHETYYSKALDAVVAGYREYRSLPGSQLEWLPAFMAARGLTYLGWLHTRRGEKAAQELASQLIELAMSVVEDYLSSPEMKRY